MIDGQRIVCILARNPARANLIKSACLISQKRPAKFTASIETAPGQVAWLDTVICDMAGDADLNELAAWARRVERPTFNAIKVIFITEEGASAQWAKTKLLGKGIDFLWDERLLLDPRANWARVLKALEDAANIINDPSNSITLTPQTPAQPALTPVRLTAPTQPAAQPVRLTAPTQPAAQPVRPTAPTQPSALPASPPARAQPATQPIRPPTLHPLHIAPPSVFRPTPTTGPIFGPRPTAPQSRTTSSDDSHALPPSIIMSTPRPNHGNSFGPATKILLVDDSANARAFVEKRIRDSWQGPVEFDFAETGAMAQTKCQAFKYDILFLDIVLPDLDGYAVCKSLKNTKNVGSLAVMLTSKGGAFDKLKGMMSGCDLYIVKPIEADHVAEVYKKHKANLAAKMP